MHEAPAVVLLMVLTFGVSVWAFENPALQEKLLFRPERILAGKEYYRLLSSGLIHGGWAHLLVNLYTLNAFASAIAWVFGQSGFLVIYIGSVLGGSPLSLYLHRFHDYSAYGASGGVCGILIAYALRLANPRMNYSGAKTAG